jgi:DNA-binding NtrC family response regulator
VCGVELIEHVRAADLAIIPIVVMTTTSPEAKPLLGAGAIEWLAKPFDIDDLLSCVARATVMERGALSTAIPRSSGA